jgi:ATP-dependent helicase HrpB
MLPIDEFIPGIIEKFKSESNLVITAAPGAGKTTRLPPALMKACTGKVIVLEPRRMAAIAAAHRIAEENGWQVGGPEVGYQVRFANKTSAATRLIFMTEALLARQLMTDPELSGVDLVILDEFHERSLHVDLALGLLRELQELGRDIKLLVMSATLEAEKIAEYLGGCSSISVPGKLFPLDVRYQKSTQSLQTMHSFYDSLVTTVREAAAASTRNILVFLPGVGEIERAREVLSVWADSRGIEVIPLHGSLALEDQRAALQASSRQRIILSTNIAESSVTLDGVDTVIDTGLSKNMRQDLRTGFSRLELGRISLSSATQRAGRAARQFPGVCYRMWNKMDELSFVKSDIAEIHRVDLTESLLFLAAQGVSDFQSFMWYEKPAALAIEKASEYLRIAGALNSDNVITELGRKLLLFPLPVRLAKLMLVGMELGARELAADMAALLQERDFLRKDSISSFLGDKFECDVTARLEVLRAFASSGKAPREASYFAVQTVAQASRQILEISKKIKVDVKPTPQGTSLVKEILLRAFTDRLCRRRGSSERALMVGGRGVKIQPTSLVLDSEFFVALTGVEGSSDAETLVSLASGFDKNFVLNVFGPQVVREQDVVFIEEKGQFFKREFKSVLGLPLDEPSLLPASREEVAERLPSILAGRLDAVLKANEGLALWFERLKFLEVNLSKAPEDVRAAFNKTVSASARASLVLEAFGQACMGEKSMDAVVAKDLVFFFESVFPSEVVSALREELPGKLDVPSGSRIRVIYPEDKPPYLEVRIQEIFGWLATPTVFWGKFPVTLHLLGPNFRPVQVTSNLESFWKTGYAEVRKELRIKYPKHQWPEDPADGVAEAKGRRRH